jgi:hypothetical protein
MIEYILKLLTVSAPTLVLTAIVISTMCVYTLCQSRDVNVIIKWISPPMAFGLIFATLIWITSIFGLPRYEFPQGKWSYIWHEERYIEEKAHALLLAHLFEDNTDRLYLFPVTEDDKEGLRKMKEGTQGGRDAQGEFKAQDGTEEFREGSEPQLQYKFADEFPAPAKETETTTQTTRENPLTVQH